MAKRVSRVNPASIPNGTAVASFKNYQQAVDYVEQILRGDFPVRAIAIVGTDLSTVERVRGKINYAKVALNGAMTGTWLGLMIYLIFGLSPQGEASGQFNLTAALFVGAGLGMLWQVVRFSLAKNKRTFASGSQVVANKYEVMVPSELVHDAEAAFKKGGEKEA